jgi:catechol 2,3-dioxygenase-like lactoylglutathione lyase family enzyme
VLVDDQAKAHKFYTEILGFETRKNDDVGGARWLTVGTPGSSDGIELLLEPNWNPAVPAKEWQASLFKAGIPAAMFGVDNVDAEFKRLTGLGVVFCQQPSTHQGNTTATFEDTCGNLIMIVSPTS